eukprot:Blabericola_migrator_1__7155@NODE_362_length_9426_cov_300_827118_g290_i0_p4_GENE_NODE_362_length_9426_cov_300_827118_g290_i0NODE_362_length_9426_cov_300_827118_g290_i0_p4_ORF_typecomplete_len234_score43_32CTP_transf_like/PF01467_26/3_2e15_NODE_362_length_9426_cov_300_827118_g290_i060766777
MKRRGAIFGGAFDPITSGHLLQVSELLNLQAVSDSEPFFDHIWLVPSGNGRWDKTASISDTLRLELCQEALNEYLPRNQRARVTVSTLEIDCGHFIPSKELWERFTNMYPEYDEIFLAIGDDQASQIKRWRHGEFLLKQVPFIVTPRPLQVGQVKDQDRSQWPAKAIYVPDMNTKFEFAQILVSSTEVRQRIKTTLEEGGDHCLLRRRLQGLVPACVVEKIIANRLYTSFATT